MMAPDQLHEQNNEKIKGVGGAVHLVNRTNERVDKMGIMWSRNSKTY